MSLLTNPQITTVACTLATNTILKNYVVEPVKFIEAAQFRSFYGKFIIMGVPVEVMGNRQIKK